MQLLLGVGVRLLAVLADPPHQPLRHHQVHRAGHVEGLDPHVDHAGDGRWRVVGVQGGEHQVAGERRLDGDAAGLQIPDLADHDDVRVLPQERPQRRGERQADLVAHQHLVDPHQVVLDRVFGGHDVGFDRVDPLQRRVERGGLARAGRSGHQHHPVRVEDGLHQVRLGLRLEAELLQVQRQVALVEDPEHDLLAVDAGQRRDPEIDDPAAHLELEAAVLRHPPLGDVELGQDLDAAGQRRLHLDRRLHDLEQGAVDPVAHPDLMLERLDVDVGRAPLDRVGQDAVDQLDHRRVVDLRLGGGLLLVLLDHLDIAVADLLHVLQQRLQLLVGGLVVLFDEGAEGVLAGDDREEVEAGDELEVVEDPGIGRIRHRHRERAALPLQRQHDVLQREVRRNQPDDLDVDFEARQVHRRHAILPREDLGDLEFLDQSQLHQDVAQTVAGRFLLGQGRRELVTGDQPLANQNVTQPVAPTGRCSRHRLCGAGL